MFDFAVITGRGNNSKLTKPPKPSIGGFGDTLVDDLLKEEV